MLKRKVENGEKREIKKFLLENDMYESYVERVRSEGIYINIVKGVMKVNNLKKVRNLCESQEKNIKEWIEERLEGMDKDKKKNKIVEEEIEEEKVMEMIERGVKDLNL